MKKIVICILLCGSLFQKVNITASAVSAQTKTTIEKSISATEERIGKISFKPINGQIDFKAAEEAGISFNENNTFQDQEFVLVPDNSKNLILGRISIQPKLLYAVKQNNKIYYYLREELGKFPESLKTVTIFGTETKEDALKRGFTFNDQNAFDVGEEVLVRNPFGFDYIISVIAGPLQKMLGVTVDNNHKLIPIEEIGKFHKPVIYDPLYKHILPCTIIRRKVHDN